MLSFIIGYVLGIFSIIIYSTLNISSKVSRLEENKEMKTNDFNKKYNLGKEFCEEKNKE